jgi:ketopantoate reductase
MGSLFGGLLAESGQTVTLIDINDSHLDVIRQEGLRLHTDQGTGESPVSRHHDRKQRRLHPTC